jgi:hypothetical protein
MVARMKGNDSPYRTDVTPSPTGYSRQSSVHRQAICAGMLVRISKFMLVVTQLSAGGNRAEVVAELNRSILETAVNLEFLVTSNNDAHFDNFVTLGLGPERELFDTIQANIAARGGNALPIERRMLSSINDVCRMSGVRIEDIERRHKDWAGNVRARLQAIGKGEQLHSGHATSVTCGAWQLGRSI